MKQETLTTIERTELRKGPTGRLRRSGKIPAVIYGHNKPVTVAVEEREFEKKFHKVSENTIITLKAGKKSWDVLVKDFQDDIISGKIKHIDFYEVEKGKKLKTNVPLHLVGTSIGVREGGLLEQMLHEIEVECLPKDIPEKFDVDINDLVLNSSVHVSDLPETKGVKILTHAENVILSILSPKAEKVEEEVEEEETEEAAAESTEE